MKQSNPQFMCSNQLELIGGKKSYCLIKIMFDAIKLVWKQKIEIKKPNSIVTLQGIELKLKN